VHCALECCGLVNITGLHKYSYSYTVELTGHNESDESKQRVAEPKDDAREDDVSCKRQTDCMVLLSSTDQLCLLRQTAHQHTRLVPRGQQCYKFFSRHIVTLIRYIEIYKQNVNDLLHTLTVHIIRLPLPTTVNERQYFFPNMAHQP